MKLSEYLAQYKTEEEITVTDIDYDIEVYFYSGMDLSDTWNQSLYNLSELLEVAEELDTYYCAVNLSQLIESKLPQLKQAELFISCEVDDIMDDIENILSGCVSENWMQKFVEILEEV